MASEIFIDTGGFFAQLSPHDHWHAEALDVLENLKSGLVFLTTDYVLDETITLLQSRGQRHLIEPWLNSVMASEKCEIAWMDPSRFDEVRRFFAKHSDQEWSFTDCFSFCVMKERKMRQALAADMHFRQAGFEPLLAS